MTQFTAALASPFTEDVLAVANERNPAQATEITVTTGDQTSNNFRDGGYAWPSYVCHTFWLTAASGDRIECGNFGWHGQRADGWLDGASCRVYRVVSDAMELVRTDTVQTCACRPIDRGTDNAWVTATSYQWAPNWLQHSWTWFFRVHAIDANGDKSPNSTIVSATPTADGGTANNTFHTSGPAWTGNTSGTLLTAPANVSASLIGNNVVEITWDAVGGAAGYLVERCGYVEFDDADYIDLAGDESAAINSTDMVVIDKEFDPSSWTAVSDIMSPNHSASTYYEYLWKTLNLSPFSADYTLTHHVDSDGIPYVTVDVPAGKTARGVITAFQGAGGGGWYSVKEPQVEYITRLVARSATNPHAVTITPGITANSTGYTPTLTSSWQDCDAPYTRTSLDTSDLIEWQDFVVTGPASVDLRAFYVFDGRALPNKELSPNAQSALEGTVPDYLRTHEICKSNPRSYKLKHVTGPIGHQNVNGMTLFDLLSLHKSVGSKPWLQIEWHWSDEDWLGFAEFMCARYDPVGYPAEDTPALKPWAYLRHLQGQQDPWIDEFDKLYFEAGNENWNNVGGFYTMHGFSGHTMGAVNAMMSDRIIGVLRSSPHWVDAKWEYVLGGWGGDTNGYNTDMAEYSRHADYLMRSAYIYGRNLSSNAILDSSNDDHWQLVACSGIRHLPDATGLQAICNGIQNISRVGRTKPMKAGIYEGNHEWFSWALDDTGKDTLEKLVNSVCGATALFDMFLSSNVHGSVSNNMFALTDMPQAYSTHSRHDRGGKPLTNMMWCNLWAEHFSGGTIRKVEQVAGPTVTTIDGDTFDALGMYRIDNGAKTYIAILNRDVSHNLEGRVHVPAKSPVVRHYMNVTGPFAATPHKATNVTQASKDDVVMDSEAVVGNTSPLVVTIPAGMAEVYEFG